MPLTVLTVSVWSAAFSNYITTNVGPLMRYELGHGDLLVTGGGCQRA